MVSGAHKGKMHRLKNAPPRQWVVPPRTLTVEQFRELTRRRDLKQNDNSKYGASIEENKEEGESKDPEEVSVFLDEKGKGSAAADLDELQISNADGKVKISKASGVKESDVRTNDGNEKISNDDGKVNVSKASGVKQSDIRTNDGKGEVVSTWTAEKEQRRLEVARKLAAAQEKKHNLVQMLKMILNAEEEIKRGNVHPAAPNAWVPTQGETTADMGSASRLVPKLSVEVNFSGDQGMESDRTACHSSHGQQITKPFMQNMPRSSLTTSGAATTRPSVSSFKDTRRTASSS